MSEPSIERYGVYWVSLNPVRGHEMQGMRPCVVVSPDAMHVTGMAVICPLTRSLHPRWAHRIPFRCAGEDAEIEVDQIRAVDLRRFRGRMDRLNEDAIQALKDAIVRMYGT